MYKISLQDRIRVGNLTLNGATWRGLPKDVHVCTCARPKSDVH